MDKTLTIGRVYAIGHKRKGDFRAVLIDIVPGDAADPELLTVKIDTRPGSGQERLARTARAAVTVTNLRPSLIVRIEEMTGEGESWLLSQRVTEEAQRRQRVAVEAQLIHKGRSRLDKIAAFIGRLGGKHG